MLLLDLHRQNEYTHAPHSILVFGLGLVGQSIANVLQNFNQFTSLHFAYDWDDRKKRLSQSKTIAKHVKKSHSTDGLAGNIDIIWSAGRGGFNASMQELDIEYEAFCDVLLLAQELNDQLQHASVTVHIMGSAGGLFEAQTLVDHHSKPNPLRPYSDNKLRQEKAAKKLPPDIAHTTYRLSSVYGFIKGARLGLISALTLNAVQTRPTQIYGNLDTIRDFVFVDDIAHFVSKQIMNKANTTETVFLVSSKPTALTEIIRLVQDCVSQPVSLNYSAKPTNSANNSYRTNLLPDGFNPTPLLVGIKKTALLIQE
jgi:UDP-glucose 4-epimerase